MLVIPPGNEYEMKNKEKYTEHNVTAGEIHFNFKCTVGELLIRELFILVGHC